jgi:hypothetical protein
MPQIENVQPALAVESFGKFRREEAFEFVG